LGLKTSFNTGEPRAESAVMILLQTQY